MSLRIIVWDEGQGLIERIEAAHGELTVMRAAEDLAEVLALVAAEVASDVLLAGGASELVSGFVDALHEAGGRAVALTADRAEAARLRSLGLGIAAPGADVATIAEAFHDARRGKAWGPARPPEAGGQRRTLAPAADSADPESAAASGADENGHESRRPGTITVVWGTHGAPGRSLVALNLAAELALAGRRVCLVDADTHAASIAACLGLLDETAGLVRLCRAVEAGSFEPGADSEAFARTHLAGATLRVTSGLPRPERWAEVSAPALTRALRALADVCDEVVVDVAASAWRDEDLAMDTFAPQRNDATTAAMACADRLLVLGTADAIGVPRLIRACEQLSVQQGDALIEPVFTRLRRAAAGARPERELRRAWERFGPAGLRPVAYLPEDRAAADAALAKGAALAEAAPRSQLRLAIRDLAQRGEDSTVRARARSARRERRDVEAMA